MHSIKVVLRLKDEKTDEVAIEVAWADFLGNDQYQLKNFPFFVYGISYNDIFEAKISEEDDERPYFTKMIKKSGHKTVRLIFKESIEESDESLKVLDTLKEMGCGYEGNGKRFFVINIQPQCDFWKVCEFLIDSEVNWEFADPTNSEIDLEQSGS